jgi:hypothetical protein
VNLPQPLCFQINIVRRKPINAVDQSQCNLANALFRHRPYVFWWLTEFREWLSTGVRTKNGPFAHSYWLSANNLELAIPEGIEPSTCRLEVGCSIQLSYGTAQGVFCGVGGRLASRLRVKEWKNLNFPA